MSIPSGYWQDLSTADLRAPDPERTIALLPVAATEQHGPHLPLGTDAIINAAIVAETLTRLPGTLGVLALPALDVGHSLEHSQFPGTLSATAANLLELWVGVGRGVADAGVRKLVIFNSHGGQRQLVDVAALRLRAELGMLAVRASYFGFGIPPGLFDDREARHGIHGGELETSLMLHLRPDLVRRDCLEDFSGLTARMAREGRLLGPERPVGFGWLSQDLNPAGACGNAARADAERGAALFNHLVQQLTRLLVEVAETPLTLLRPPPR
jgi:creatinine amidohydrolase